MAPARADAAARMVITPGLRVTRLPGGGLSVTSKFIEGVREYMRHWPGQIRVAMHPSDHASDNLDEKPVDPGALGFELCAVDYRTNELEDALRGAALCLAGTDHMQTHVPALCARLGVPCVIVTEYTLKTRCQMTKAQGLPPARFLRHCAWQVREEMKVRRALRLAAGAQCNGTPTYEAYRSLTPDTMLFFDTRVAASMLADDGQISARRRPGPLRLVFSGRLIAAKGAHHIPEVAAELSRRSVDYTLTVCGDGVMRPVMDARVAELAIGDRVRFTGTLQFATRLVPFVRDQCDLFVCCHPQGDPSCTYLETMSCGVPIAGYANEAFAGLAPRAQSGWLAPMGNARALAGVIARLAGARDEIDAHARRALAFAREHTFDKTFARRVEHMVRVMERARSRN